jgi:hypothetical protein
MDRLGNTSSVPTSGRSPGFDIALAGIDGVGKSTVSEALTEALRARGYVVTMTSWRGYLSSAIPAEEKSPLRDVYLAQLRTLFSASTGAGRVGAAELLASRDEHPSGNPAELAALDDPSVQVALDPHRPNTFLAAGLLEVAARMIEREAVIDPALARGEVVIQESHGLKNCVKLGLVAEHLERGGDTDECDRSVAAYLAVVQRSLLQWAAPAMTVLVAGDPRLAYAWRRSQKGFIPRSEHLDADGRPAEWTFVDLQTDLQKRLMAIAEAQDWPRVTMTSKPQEQNVALAVEVILDALTDRGILAGEPAR